MTVVRAFRPVVLCIAGSDSGGGAGIQADLKAVTSVGAWGATAVTCLTSQNLDGVRSVQPTDPGVLADQIDAVCEGFEVRAVKTGMLFSSELIEVIVERLRHHRPGPLVVDPVMVATSGAKLLQDSAINALREDLLPLATVVTPNLHEAEILAGIPVSDPPSMKVAAASIQRLGPDNVLVKGGHLDRDAIDVLLVLDQVIEYRAPRVETTSATHGTGCTMASAIAAGLAFGSPVAEAVAAAKKLVTTALQQRVSLGGAIEAMDVFRCCGEIEGPPSFQPGTSSEE